MRFELPVIRIVTLVILVHSGLTLYGSLFSEDRRHINSGALLFHSTKKSVEFLTHQQRFNGLPFASSKREVGYRYESLLKGYLNENPFDHTVWLELVEVQKYLDTPIEERDWVLGNAFSIGQWDKKFRDSALLYCFDEPFVDFDTCKSQSLKLDDRHPWSEELKSKLRETSLADHD